MSNKFLSLLLFVHEICLNDPKRELRTALYLLVNLIYSVYLAQLDKELCDGEKREKSQWLHKS